MVDIWNSPDYRIGDIWNLERCATQATARVGLGEQGGVGHVVTPIVVANLVVVDECQG